MADHHSVNRRTFLSALTACAASAAADTLLASPGAPGGADRSPVARPVRVGRQTGAAAAGRIDMHHHFAPPAWIEEVRGRPLLQPANTRWTPAQSLEDMDRGGVAAAIVSITNPGIWFGDRQQTNRLARACNEFGARLVQDHPMRFGLFAAMPLPDVDATLKEIAYAYDVLKADGVGLLTSYGDTWLGNRAFRPVMEELHRRKAVVAVHPTAANCCRNLEYAPGVGPGSIEYGTDTTRAIMGVCFSGDATRFPDIRFIWSHAGGSVPFLAGRIEGASNNARDALPDGFIAQLKKFHYDLAGAANRGAIASLRELVPATQIVFGTDFPPGGTSFGVAKTLREIGMFNAGELRAIDRDNAVRLLPRFN
ncbi:MAG TPA: amidohydrolase family protein [Vicinamibacterales bacterium]|nr:amidohydrolase family protein [Vicinamibacterales bacterium]